MIDPLRHNALLDEIQAAIRTSGVYSAEVDQTGKAEVDEVVLTATSQYQAGQPLDSHAKRISETHWAITIRDPYRPAAS